MNSMVEDTEEEKYFRDRYAKELKKKKQDDMADELDDERRKVKQQGMKTPGRRGEQIKHEELDREISRRYIVGKENENNEKSNS
jgi:O-methyltransferase involved in polyketide biosynthesis